MTEDRLARFYDEKYSEEASLVEVEPVPLVEHPVDRFQGAVAALAPRVRDRDVLELAAGSGRIAQSLARSGARFRSWTLSDWAANRVDGMRLRMQGEPRFRFAVVDAAQPSKAVQGESFDVIVSIALIEHLVDPLGALADTRSLLRPGGFIYLDTPNIAKWTRRLKLAAGRFPSTSSQQEGLVTYDGQPVTLHDEGHLHYFTYHSLERMLVERCGYARVERVPYGATRKPSPAITNTLARKIPTLFSEISLIAYA